MTGCESLANAFARARSERRAALIGYIVAGDPDMETTERVIDALTHAGVDVIELGIPYADPLADGPTIAAAAQRALGAGATMRGAIDVATRAAARGCAPVVYFTYANPVDRMGVERFADEGIQVNLAISLHAPTDEQRGRIMPVNKRWPVAELLAACAAYVAKTRRKVFFEYVMLRGVNDDDQSAHALAALMRGHLYHVNLIPYNATPDSVLQGSDELRVRAFQKILDGAGVPTTVRTPMGRDIAAACGQLQAETQPRAKAG